MSIVFSLEILVLIKEKAMSYLVGKYCFMFIFVVEIIFIDLELINWNLLDYSKKKSHSTTNFKLNYITFEVVKNNFISLMS